MYLTQPASKIFHASEQGERYYGYDYDPDWYLEDGAVGSWMVVGEDHEQEESVTGTPLSTSAAGILYHHDDVYFTKTKGIGMERRLSLR